MHKEQHCIPFLREGLPQLPHLLRQQLPLQKQHSHLLQHFAHPLFGRRTNATKLILSSEEERTPRTAVALQASSVQEGSEVGEGRGEGGEEGRDVRRLEPRLLRYAEVGAAAGGERYAEESPVDL